MIDDPESSADGDARPRPPAPRSSLWERLARSAGRGVRAAADAARDLGARAASEAESEVEHESERALGELVARRFVDEGAATVSADDPAVAALLDRIRASRKAAGLDRE